jgi:FMN phosphatase YigB (HAD superfamily)
VSRRVTFFDLDGVLADFVSGALRLHGRTDFPYADIRWGIEEQLGIEPAKFWAPMGSEFWAGLPLYDDGHAAFSLVARTVGPENVALLSSPCETPGCLDGKRAWVAKHLPEFRKRLFLGGAKHLFAGPGKVFVDDHDANVDAFRAAGGKAVQVPRPWNRRRDETLLDGRFDAVKLYGEVTDAA